MSDLRERGLRWLLLAGSRTAIAGLLVAGTFFVLLGLGVLGVVDYQDEGAVRSVATAFIPGLIAFLSIVLGINQLVLSQEFGSTAEIRGRIESIRDYRDDVESKAGSGPSPVLPVDFLEFLVKTIRLEGTTLQESVDDGTDPTVRDAVERLAASIERATTTAHDSLESLESGRINALLPILEYDDSTQLYRTRRIQREYGESLPEATQRSLSSLVEALELLSVARTKFRTTYTQRVLAGLSRELLYVGIPALLSVITLGLLEPAAGPIGSGLGRLLTVSALLAFGFAPLAVLSAYLLRIAAISERTIAIGPFVSRPSTVRVDQRPEPDQESVRDESTTDEHRPTRDEHRPTRDEHRPTTDGDDHVDAYD